MRLTSTIKHIDKKKKYGYISSLQEKKDFVFWEDSLDGVNFEDLQKGDEVTFESASFGDKLKAQKVRLVDSSPSNDIRDNRAIETTKEATLNVSRIDTAQSSEVSDFYYLLPNETLDASELIIGIVSPVGTNSKKVIEKLETRLEALQYSVNIIKISQLLPNFQSENISEYERIQHYMKQGDRYRKESKNNSILVAGAINKIKSLRNNKDSLKRVFIIDSLKHPQEVELFRKVYAEGFYLFGIHANEAIRQAYLVNSKHCTEAQAKEIILRDENEDVKHGQKTRDTFHLADFFLSLSDSDTYIDNTLERFIELIFSNPHLSPTFDEYAMFMAFNSSVRSSDLSRQVGAVITKDNQILSTGANDVPKSGGGLYWAMKDTKSAKVTDTPLGKDYTRGYDSNKKIQNDIVEEIIKKIKEQFPALFDDYQEKNMADLKLKLKNTKIGDLTEFGRIVHAEMEAILACSREGITTKDTTLYCTTFPCHNCAKHIIASGVKRVVYVEPYPKSKALDFYDDSIKFLDNIDESNSNDKQENDDKVLFEPFTGVGSRRFLDLFSMSLGVGNKLKRKNSDGEAMNWELRRDGKIRTPMIFKAYEQIELDALKIWNRAVKQIQENS